MELDKPTIIANATEDLQLMMQDQLRLAKQGQDIVDKLTSSKLKMVLKMVLAHPIPIESAEITDDVKALYNVISQHIDNFSNMLLAAKIIEMNAEEQPAEQNQGEQNG